MLNFNLEDIRFSILVSYNCIQFVFSTQVLKGNFKYLLKCLLKYVCKKHLVVQPRLRNVVSIRDIIDTLHLNLLLPV